MGFLDDVRSEAPAPAAKPETAPPQQLRRNPDPDELPAPARAVIAAALSIPHPYGLPTRDVRAHLIARLSAARWICRTGIPVDSRGSKDGYRGRIELVAHPPPVPGHPLPPPVLVEIDRGKPQRKAITKLARYEGQAAARIILLTRAPSPEFTPPGVDAVAGLA